MKRFILGLVVFQLAIPALASVDILGIRIWHSPHRTRLVFDLSGPSNTAYLIWPIRNES